MSVLFGRFWFVFEGILVVWLLLLVVGVLLLGDIDWMREWMGKMLEVVDVVGVDCCLVYGDLYFFNLMFGF